MERAETSKNSTNLKSLLQVTLGKKLSGVLSKYEILDQNCEIHGTWVMASGSITGLYDHIVKIY